MSIIDGKEYKPVLLESEDPRHKALSKRAALKKLIKESYEEIANIDDGLPKGELFAIEIDGELRSQMIDDWKGTFISVKKYDLVKDTKTTKADKKLLGIAD